VDMEVTMANPNQCNPDQGNDKSNRLNDPAGERDQRQQEQETDRARKQQGGTADQNQQRRDTERRDQQR